MSNKTFIERVKKECGISRLDLPRNIKFEFDDFIIKVTLGSSAVTSNMQTDSAAFEGWILVLMALYSNNKMEFRITMSDDDFNKGKEHIGHMNRFLYRLTRFCEKFSNVDVLPGTELHTRLNHFYYNGKYEKMNCYKLVVNVPKKEAGVNDKPEIIIEKQFAEKPDELFKKTEELYKNTIKNFSITKNTAHRQLPVGVFCDMVKKGNNIFTAGASAIDLWSLTDNGDTLCIYELKALNPMVGIISELFFYSNLVEDIYVKNKIEYKGHSTTYRGFKELDDNYFKISKIAAIFLADNFHPLVNDKIVELLNSNSENIKYGIIKYDYTLNIMTPKSE